MSRDGFREIVKFLRFYVRSTRTQRLTTDKFGLISEVWYNFISNAQSCYTPGPYITIDEQLFPSKCRCRFTQFKGSKPDTIYQGKHYKNVLLLSTMHPDIQIETGTKKKPDVVSFYYSSKYGVDVVDQMARKYSVKAPSRRWPVHTFYNLLDLAEINSSILFCDLNGKNLLINLAVRRRTS
ncbi:unnamed protein product [Euphydryas editha]|uniref:PiggyBac transposable element-derived protein domain-containing protein n=1 Tax=Euphydryas editha TaxID=104508 RepID=A0AAU9TBR6_EUPED|nr:unnamed protein product [Euphydryas editha]